MWRVARWASHVVIAVLAFATAYEVTVAPTLDWWLLPANFASVFQLAALYAAVAAIVELALGIERYSWRFVSLRDAIMIARSCAVSALAFLAVYFVVARAAGLPRSTFVLVGVFQITGLLGLRVLWRARFDGNLLRSLLFLGDRSKVVRPGDIKLAVVGEPFQAEAFLRGLEMDTDHRYAPVAVICPSPGDRGGFIRSVPVIGSTATLGETCQALALRGREPDAMLFLSEPHSLPGVTTEQLADLTTTGVKLLRRPAITEVNEVVSAATLTEITFEELLSRPSITLDDLIVRNYLCGKKVLVTGAGGSIGSELSRQVAAMGCSNLALLDSSESSLFAIAAELRDRMPSLPVVELLCDIRDGKRLAHWFEAERPDIVFHTAALKHVPMLETYPCEAVLTNICGTANVIAAAQKCQSGHLVLVSTDKAVDPSSVMGATKRIAEVLARTTSRASSTRFSVVRFGNVLGSSGSVVPTFRRQIERGGPVTVTHEAVERFFMTIPEAVQLVLHASAVGGEGNAGAGRLFVLEMGKPVKIIDLARQMITLMGKKPGVDIEIKVTGLRPGEKLSEDLVDVGEIVVKHSETLLEVVNRIDQERFQSALIDDLERAAVNGDATLVRERLFAAVRGLREYVAEVA